MKYLLLLPLILLAGCTSTTVDYGSFHLQRISFGQTVNAQVTIDGETLSVKYGNDGGSETSKSIASGVAGAVIGSQGL